jgi:hypothetical protein
LVTWKYDFPYSENPVQRSPSLSLISLTHKPYILLALAIGIFLACPFGFFAHGQPDRKADVSRAFHSNFGQIERIAASQGNLLQVVALQSKQSNPLLASPKINQTIPSNEITQGSSIEKKEVFSQSTNDSQLAENDISEEEIKEMLFGADEMEEVVESGEEFTDEKKWFPSLSAKFGVGYSDNPMYGPYIREESAYIEMESELFLLRQGSPNYLTYLYLFGEGKHFDGLPQYDLSGILLAQAEHTYVTDNASNSFGLRLRHTYYDQAFDFSDLGLPYSMQIQSNKSEMIPHLSHRFSDNITAKIEVSAGSERFDDPSENNSDQQIRVALDWQLTEKLNLEAKLSGRSVDYDAREKREADGSLLPDGKLETNKVGFALTLGHQFSSPWLKSVEWEGRINQLEDNAGGYYDYEKIGTSLSHSAKWKKWLLETELSWSQFNYEQRTVLSGEKFDRQGFESQLILTREINENWNAYLKWNREEDQSNSRDYEYFSNFYSIGVSWEQ